MNCTVQEAEKLAKEDGGRFNEIVMIVRAENIVNRQIEKERRRTGG